MVFLQNTRNVNISHLIRYKQPLYILTILSVTWQNKWIKTKVKCETVFSVDQGQTHTEEILLETASTLISIEKMQQCEKKEVEKPRRDSKPDQDLDRTIMDDDKVD